MKRETCRVRPWIRGSGYRIAHHVHEKHHPQVSVTRTIPCRKTHHPLPGRQGRPGSQRGQILELRDAGDPVEQAQVYDREGADELVFLDITASQSAAIS